MSAARNAIHLKLAPSAPQAQSAPLDLPPPGLYRVDDDTRVRQQAGPHELSVDFQTDGRSGDQSSQARVAGMSDGGRTSKGSGPLTQCIRSGPPVLLPPTAAGVCKTLSTTRSGAGLVQVASCPTGKMTLTMRRLGERTWETVTELDMSSGTRPDLGGTRSLLELAARQGGSARERAEAAKALAALPRMQGEMDADRVRAGAGLDAALTKARTPEEKALVRQALARMDGQVPVKTRSRVTLTRIAATCTP